MRGSPDWQVCSAPTKLRALPSPSGATGMGKREPAPGRERRWELRPRREFASLPAPLPGRGGSLLPPGPGPAPRRGGCSRAAPPGRAPPPRAAQGGSARDPPPDWAPGASSGPVGARDVMEGAGPGGGPRSLCGLGWMERGTGRWMDGQRDRWTGGILAGSGMSTQNVLSPARPCRQPPALGAGTSFPCLINILRSRSAFSPGICPASGLPLGTGEDLRRVNSGKFVLQVICCLGKDPVPWEQ